MSIPPLLLRRHALCSSLTHRDDVETRAGFEAVKERIGVLHEDLLNKIAASTERDAVSRQEFKEAMAGIAEKFGRRLDPLEATARTHSAATSAAAPRRAPALRPGTVEPLEPAEPAEHLEPAGFHENDPSRDA